MSCSVNLVPAKVLHARIRAGRLRGWAAVCAATGVLLASAWAIRLIAADTLERFSESIDALAVQQREVQERFRSAHERRAALIRQLQTYAAARQPQPWPHRLTSLTREAPEGVFLTQVSVTTLDQTAAAEAVGTAWRDAAWHDADSETPANVGHARPAPHQAVRLFGHALDHGALVQLLNVLEDLPDWRRVALVSATQEPCGAAQAIAFQLDCRCGGPDLRRPSSAPGDVP